MPTTTLNPEPATPRRPSSPSHRDSPTQLDQAALTKTQCWQAVQERDRGQDGEFVFAVKTTGVFCRPSCGARLPLRTERRLLPVERGSRGGRLPALQALPADRIRRRRRPGGAALRLHPRQCRLRRQARARGAQPQLAGLSKSHLQRIFRAAVGVSPRQYVEACRLGALKRELQQRRDGDRRDLRGGFGAASRLYERVDSRLGMTPRQYGQGGQGLAISYTVLDSRFGRLLLAATDRGLCFVELGDDEKAMVAALRREFPRAKIAAGRHPADARARALGPGARAAPRRPGSRRTSCRSTCAPPPSSSRSGATCRPSPAARCAPTARSPPPSAAPKRCARWAAPAAKTPPRWSVPCHRVIRGDGGLGGYRWGEDRKRQMLRAEGVKIAGASRGGSADPGHLLDAFEIDLAAGAAARIFSPAVELAFGFGQVGLVERKSPDEGSRRASRRRRGLRLGPFALRVELEVAADAVEIVAPRSR